MRALKELMQQVYHYREINGATMDPMSAYLILRGMKNVKITYTSTRTKRF